MGWEKNGRYYTRSRREGGRVVREYVGTGEVASLAAQLDEVERERRRLALLELRRAKAELVAFEVELQALEERTDLAARAALLAAGYRQHHRGEWRKYRG